ncbi:hypothetical protein ACFTZI_20805 [Streptomyces decoyicus]|uniref:hypothetical protein n=1 Tax=Streptomyces decoyicus TaxID=249567 RepID=UPI003638DCD8
MRKMVEVTQCDACGKKGKEREATTALSVAGDSYDLCDEHGKKFRTYFAALFSTEKMTAQSA